MDSIYKGIDECKAVLFMLSDNSIDSEWTRREIDYAEELNKRIIPVVIDGRGLRGWALEKFKRINFVDRKKSEDVTHLIKNLKEWYPNIGNEYYLKLAKDFLAEHPKELRYAVRFELDAELLYVAMKIVPLSMDEVLRIRRCIAKESKIDKLDKRISKHCPDVYRKFKEDLTRKWMEIVEIEDIDKEMVFLTCNVAVFEEGMDEEPKRIKVPISMTYEHYEDLLAWKLESRPREAFSLQHDMRPLCDRIISQVKKCIYLDSTNRYRDLIVHPFAFEIVELEQDANEILGEREIESVIFDVYEDPYYQFSEYTCVEEYYQTILQIYERHLYFGASSSSWDNFTIELSDVRDFQKMIGATCYKDIQKWIKKEFGEFDGVVQFRSWLEEQRLPYLFHEEERLESGWWGPV